MKRVFIISFLVASLLSTLIFWSCTAGGITTSLGQEFTLPVGQKAVIEGEQLTIKFVEVFGDSRCPTGVECPWIGEANCRLLFTYAGSPAEMVFAQPGGVGATTKDYFIQYKFVCKLEPYPQKDQQIDASDYKLVMTVTKK